MVRIVTVTDKEPHASLLQSARRLDVIKVEKYFTHGLKLVHLKEYAKQHEDEIILFVDAFDTLLCASEQDISNVATRLLTNAEVVFSSESNCFPEQTKKRFMKVYKPTGRFGFLNAGVILGKGKHLYSFLNRKTNDELLFYGRQENGTCQGVCTSLFLDFVENKFVFPRVAIDHECVLAASHYNVSSSEFDFSGRPFFKPAQSSPCVIHFNGNSYLERGVDLRNVYADQIKPETLSIVVLTVCVHYSKRFAYALAKLQTCSTIQNAIVVTSPDDVETIALCKSFPKVILLSHDFHHVGSRFDKGCAIAGAQLFCREHFPKAWHLIMDADIVLPDNFEDSISCANLQSDTLYGVQERRAYASRRDFFRQTNFILDPSSQDFVGFFQLYKLSALDLTYQHSWDAGGCDNVFRDRFVKKELLPLTVSHLGAMSTHWSGIQKDDDWIEDD